MLVHTTRLLRIRVRLNRHRNDAENHREELQEAIVSARQWKKAEKSKLRRAAKPQKPAPSSAP
jgi:hypothetical protein